MICKVSESRLASHRAFIRRMQKAIRWIVGVVIFLIPLWFLPITGDILEFNKQILLLVAAGIGLVIYLVNMIKAGKLTIAWTPMNWGFLALLGATIVGAIGFRIEYPYKRSVGSNRLNNWGRD